MKNNEFKMIDARTPEQIAATNAEFPYGCECGEQYTTIGGAECCRKCRTYLADGGTGSVVDLRTGSVVVEGRKPLPPVDRTDWLDVDPTFLE